MTMRILNLYYPGFTNTASDLDISAQTQEIKKKGSQQV